MLQLLRLEGIWTVHVALEQGSILLQAHRAGTRPSLLASRAEAVISLEQSMMKCFGRQLTLWSIFNPLLCSLSWFTALKMVQQFFQKKERQRSRAS